jgi:hypothetical protein
MEQEVIFECTEMQLQTAVLYRNDFYKTIFKIEHKL